MKSEDTEAPRFGGLTPIAQLPKVETWLSELATLTEGPRAERLREMQAIVKRAGGCASTQTGNGLPCRRSPKAGYPVCRKHGERAPQTVSKAERMLAIARMPAIEVLMDELDQAQEDHCTACGYPERGLKYRKHIAAIAFKLLDRTGFGPRHSIDLTAKAIGEEQIDVSVLTDTEFMELGQLLEQMDQLKTRVNARIAADQTRNILAPIAAAALQSDVQGGDTPEGRETEDQP